MDMNMTPSPADVYVDILETLPLLFAFIGNPAGIVAAIEAARPQIVGAFPPVDVEVVGVNSCDFLIA